MDPEHGNATKFIQVLLTAFVSVPTSRHPWRSPAACAADAELGWIAALPWERPMVLATGCSAISAASVGSLVQ
jgi:cytochrome c oxidase subunit I